MVGIFPSFVFEFFQQIRYLFKLEMPFQIVMVEERGFCLTGLVRIDRCEDFLHFIFEILTLYLLEWQVKVF